MNDKLSISKSLTKSIHELRKLSIQERTKKNDSKIYSHMIELMNEYESTEGRIQKDDKQHKET